MDQEISNNGQNNPETHKRSASYSLLLTALLLLTYFAMGMAQVRHASITFDEGPHLAIGYTTLRTGDFRLQPVHIHPPLANVLAGAPLLLQPDLPDPRSIDGWDIDSLSAITDTLVWQYPEPARIATAGRMPMLLLGVLLGAVIARWAKDLGGPRAGLLTLALYAFDPNFIAHGSLITTDMAATFCIVATLYVVNYELRITNYELRMADGQIRGKALRLILIGLLLGLAQLAKVSALMLVPVVGLILFVGAVQVKSQKSKPARIGIRSQKSNHVSRFTFYVLRSYTVVFLTAALVIWAGYGFQVTAVPGLPFKVPAGTHLRIFQSLQEHYDLGHPTFALGKLSEHGWWWYFPLAFVLKTPLPSLILTLWAFSRFTFHERSQKSKVINLTPASIALWLFPLLYALSSLFSTVNIGYRHLLPILPFLYIGIGQMTNDELRITNYVSRFTFYVLLFWLLAGTLITLPYPLTFFNELAGGARNGYRYLVDSNLDWGQNLWDLKAWMQEHDEDHVYYAHYNPARPQTYGINADFLPPDPRAVSFAPWNPAPGLYAIGATVLQGPYAPGLNTYAWFRSREAAVRLGNALFVYRVPARPAPTWAVLCTDISTDMLKANLGEDNSIRILQPDCLQARVYANGGTPGLYVAEADAEPPPGAYVDAALRDAGGTPTTTIYRIETLPAPQSPVEEVSIDGPLTFVGYALHGTDQLWTYWRIADIAGRPLSLMAHLIGPDGTTAAVGDGLGFPIEQWQVGDLIIQYHTLTPPAEAAPGTYTIHVGGYWLDTMERWAIAIEDQTHDHLDLLTVEIQSQ